MDIVITYMVVNDMPKALIYITFISFGKGIKAVNFTEMK